MNLKSDNSVDSHIGSQFKKKYWYSCNGIRDADMSIQMDFKSAILILMSGNHFKH